MAVINLLIIGALIATVVVLTLGLRSMSRGGAYDTEHAEKFMWERIALPPHSAEISRPRQHDRCR